MLILMSNVHGTRVTGGTYRSGLPQAPVTFKRFLYFRTNSRFAAFTRS